jgi:PleD family two-component response regulator
MQTLRPFPPACQEPISSDYGLNGSKTHPKAKGRQPSNFAVDDDPHIRELLRRELRERGYRVGLAVFGRGALAEIHRERPNLVIFSMNVPRILVMELPPWDKPAE